MMHDLTAGGSDRLPNVHPGDVLREDYTEALGITAYRLAKDTGLSQTHIGDILRGERSITALTALKLSAYFGTTPEFWLNLQAAFDLEEARLKFGDDLKMIPKHPRTIEVERMMQELETSDPSVREFATV
jgi:addiction module HigA family antidote